jgi:isochorismate hydrolase
MSSNTIRDQVNDHLLTPKNSALVIIDYQPVQVKSVASMDRRALVENITTVAKLAMLFGLPVVLSTVNVKTGKNQPTIHQLTEVLGDIETYDRTSINAWEDAEFQAAVKTTGRKKIIMAALWTEACLIFPTLDMLREGYEVYPLADAVGGTSLTGLSRCPGFSWDASFRGTGIGRRPPRSSPSFFSALKATSPRGSCEFSAISPVARRRIGRMSIRPVQRIIKARINADQS